MTTVLLDGDVTAYQFSARAEEATCWDDIGEFWTLHADEQTAKGRLDNYLTDMMDTLKGHRMVIALSDPEENWRKDVLPSYKVNRKDMRKPMILFALKEYMRENYEVWERPTLEGDDVLGILMTSNKIIKGDRVCVSIDKDMKTIPGQHFNTQKRKDGIYSVTKEEADFWHLYQTLVGDVVDGYPGCPGVGSKNAKRLLKEPRRFEPVEYTISKGKRAGETGIRWEDAGECSPWEAVVSAFDKAGFGEEEALTQARVARICRNTDYDFKNRRVRLWTP